MEGHERGMEACYMEYGQAIFFENVIGIYFDVYIATKLHRWACAAPDQDRAAVKPSA